MTSSKGIYDLIMAAGGAYGMERTAFALLSEAQEHYKPCQEPGGPGQQSHGQCPLPLGVTAHLQMNLFPAIHPAATQVKGSRFPGLTADAGLASRHVISLSDTPKSTGHFRPVNYFLVMGFF